MADRKQTFPTPPDLVGKNIYLRPATSKDVANTYHWVMLSDPATQSCTPRPFKTAAEASEAYQKRTASSDEQLFMIVRQKDNVPVGSIRFFDMNLLNRSTELGLIIDPDERKKAYALEAIRLLTGYLIKTRDINKVHAQTSSLNKGAVALLEKAGFKRDGTLRHHYFYDGELHDGYVYSLLRFEFDQ
jgi:RimJ/RimL family protein N-acetyltransferase